MTQLTGRDFWKIGTTLPWLQGINPNEYTIWVAFSRDTLIRILCGYADHRDERDYQRAFQLFDRFDEQSFYDLLNKYMKIREDDLTISNSGEYYAFDHNLLGISDSDEMYDSMVVVRMNVESKECWMRYER